jgi:GNAT superfamily N-acetyltransferase
MLSTKLEPAVQTRLVTLRPAQPEDEAFLLEVYASTRAEELSNVPWSEAQKRAFVEMQSRAQRQHYALYYPGAQYLVIEAGEEPAGRLFIDRTGSHILLMDIALLPPYRGMGIGTTMIKDLMTEASKTGKTMRLHVEVFNPARRLYERLGFVDNHAMGADSIYIQMVWPAQPFEIGESQHD